MYDSTKPKEIEQIPAGETTTGVIIQITDGTIKDFIKPESLNKFEDPNQTAIEITTEFTYKEKRIRINNIYTYYNDAEGNVMLTKKSNLTKYYNFYKKLPSIGDQVKVVSNTEGYFKIIV